MGSPKYALVLFDYDGFTDIIECNRFKESPVTQTLQANIWWGSRLHKVEVLAVGDSMKDVDQCESDWANSHRAVALDEAKKTGTKGGYLAVWPQDVEETEKTEVKKRKGRQLQDNPTKKKKGTEKRPVAVLQSVTNKGGKQPGPRAVGKSTKKGLSQGKENRPAAVQSVQRQKQPVPRAGVNSTNKTQTESEKRKSRDSRVPIRNVKKGSNGREINVLHEGSGNLNGERQIPRRNPVFLDNLSPDEQDLISQQMNAFRRGVTSTASQTEPVIIMTSDEELRNNVKSVRDISTQCTSIDANCAKDDLVKYLENLLSQARSMPKVSTGSSPPSASTEVLQQGHNHSESEPGKNLRSADEMVIHESVESQDFDQSLETCQVIKTSLEDQVEFDSSESLDSSESGDVDVILEVQATAETKESLSTTEVVILKGHNESIDDVECWDSLASTAALGFQQSKGMVETESGPKTGPPVTLTCPPGQVIGGSGSGPTLLTDTQQGLVVATGSGQSTGPPITLTCPPGQVIGGSGSGQTLLTDTQQGLGDATGSGQSTGPPITLTCPPGQVIGGSGSGQTLLTDTQQGLGDATGSGQSTGSPITLTCPPGQVIGGSGSGQSLSQYVSTSTCMPSSMYKPGTVQIPFLTLFSYGKRKEIIGPCYLGPTIEISSAADMVKASVDSEIRIKGDTQRIAVLSASNKGNFAWFLAKNIYHEDEMEGRNVSGRRGKRALSPRRMHAIWHAMDDAYGPAGDNMIEARESINSALRSRKRRKSQSDRSYQNPAN